MRKPQKSATRPLITIVTVVFNDVRHIENTIKSVINQSYPCVEYLIIDGGSTDGTLEIVKQYEQHIAFWVSEPDKGIYDAMNKGIERATGEWICFMNSNDWLYRNDTLELVFSEYPSDADFIYGQHIWKDNEHEVVVKTRPLEKMWQKISFSHQSLFAKTALMKKHKFDLRYKIVCDYEFYFSHYVKGHKFYDCGKIVAIATSGGFSHRELWKRTLERWKVVRQNQNTLEINLFYLHFILTKIIGPELRKNIERLQFQKYKGRIVPTLSYHTRVFLSPLTRKLRWCRRQLLSCPRKSFPTSNELVSVIIPNYNNAFYLEACLDSVLRQTYDSLEILVIDDNSTDCSREILQRYEKKYQNIRVLYNDTNTGMVGVNRHKAILAAKGDYISTIDSDDVYLADNKLEEEMALIRKYRDVFGKQIIAFSDVMLIAKSGRQTQCMSQQRPIREGNLLTDIMTRQCMIPTHFTYQKKIYFDVGGYDSRFPIYEDWDLKIRMASKYEYYYTGIVGSGYNLHGDGLSNSTVDVHTTCLELVMNKNLALIDQEKKEEAQQHITAFIQRVRKNA